MRNILHLPLSVVWRVTGFSPKPLGPRVECTELLLDVQTHYNKSRNEMCNSVKEYTIVKAKVRVFFCA